MPVSLLAKGLETGSFKDLLQPRSGLIPGEAMLQSLFAFSVALLWYSCQRKRARLRCKSAHIDNEPIRAV